MNNVMNSEVFFFISSIGFIILGILAGIAIWYIIRAVNIFSRIVSKIEDDIENIGDTTQEMISDMRESAIFQFFFKKKRRQKK